MTTIHATLGVFARYWQPGAVKSRLAATVGPEAAAQMYYGLLTATLQELDGLVDRQVIAVTPGQRLPDFRHAFPNWSCLPQSDGDLGERMSQFFRDHCSEISADSLLSSEQHPSERSSRPTIVIGSDCPFYDRGLLKQAIEALDDVPLVLGPADDGGYYLIGMRTPVPEIFEGIGWGTGQVWEQTLRQARRLGIDIAELPVFYDIDTGEDLRRMTEDLAVATSSRLAGVLQLARQLVGQEE